MNSLALFAALLLLQTVVARAASIYDIKLKGIDGKDTSLSAYKGKVLLIVNVASKCGFTPQYKGLEATYEKYKHKGVVILGFPCNPFGGRGPAAHSGSNQFCSTRFKVPF